MTHSPSDSDEEIWNDDSHGVEFWAEAVKLDIGRDGGNAMMAGVAKAEGSSSRRISRHKPRQLVEKAIETAGHGHAIKRSSNHGASTRRYDRVIKVPLQGQLVRSNGALRANVPTQGEASGSDADRDEAGSVIETDTDSSISPTREPSFSFSDANQFPSRTTSATSVSSTSSTAPSQNSDKRRPLKYTDYLIQGDSSITSCASTRKQSHEMVPLSAASTPISSTSSTTRPQEAVRSSSVHMGDSVTSVRASPLPSPNKSAAASVVTSLSPRAEVSSMSSALHSLSLACGASGEPHSPATSPTRANAISREGGLSTSTTSSHSVTIPRGSLVPTGTPVRRALRENPSVMRDISAALAGAESPSASAAPTRTVIIAHSREAQSLMDSINIAWGVQYEIARGVSHGWWGWEDVTPTKLERLKGSNAAAAPLVRTVIMSRSSKIVAETEIPLWSELDREQEALQTDPSRCLGLKGEWKGVENWYGGRIQQIARIEKMHDAPGAPYKIVLEKMLKRKSTRFARFLGSRRMLQVSVPETLCHDPEVERVREYLSQRFILCGRVFVPFASKERKVFLMEINENFERRSDTFGDQNRISLDAFVQWHNPPRLNAKQPTSKWITRFDLGLSTSIPVLKFQGVNVDIFYIEDQVAAHDSSLEKAPTECIFTDGCGFMNGAALTVIGRLMKYGERPTVVQGRFAGSKGLWALHPEDREPTAPPRIWIRPSQVKIKYNDTNLSPAHLIFDLVAPPRVTKPSRLSRYTIMNLSHNGVPASVFKSLMEDTLRREVDALTTWSGPHDMILLWNAVNEAGHVTMANLRQQAAGGGRLFGLGRAQDRDDWQDDELEYDPNLEDTSSDAGGLQYKGDPTSLHGAVLELLQAGFHPLKLSLLSEKLRYIVAAKISETIKEFKIVVPQSAEAFIIPDPLGVLEEGQIHFKSSQELKDPLEDAYPNIITGEVLIYRNPARVPSDVQKVMAISHPALSEFVNVIVLPVKGRRSLANLLAGGDVDGDVCTCIYDQDMVKQFTASPTNDPSTSFREDNFEADIELVSQFEQKLRCLPVTERQAEMQSLLLSGLSDPPFGIYSMIHEYAAYYSGYDDPETLRVAFMFTTVLDSRKTGLKVKRDVFKSDQRLRGPKMPYWMRQTESDDPQPTPKRNARLGRNSRRFVLDELVDAGKTLENELLARYDDMRRRMAIRSLDPDLAKPFEQAKNLAMIAKASGWDPIAAEIQAIERHVQNHLQSWRELSKSVKSPQKATSSQSRHVSKAKDNKESRYMDLAIAFSRGPKEIALLSSLPASVDAIMASCAYVHAPEHSNFAFSVAFRTLCKIKADAAGSIALSREFAEAMTIPAPAVRIFSQAG